MASRASLIEFVYGSLVSAINAAEEAGIKKSAALRESMIARIPEFRELPLGTARRVWAAVLFMDMRDSSSRALRVGPRDTYVTMHAVLPAMAYLVSDYRGYIVGFRGDGLFAAFGLNAAGTNEGMDRKEAVRTASQCGTAMVEGTEGVINPLLERVEIEPDVVIGVGVDIGDVVVTRIGLADAYEITAYGNAVNRAAELGNVARSEVLLSSEGDDEFPASTGGKVKTWPSDSIPDAYRIQFPSSQLQD
jgi:adenylate cyclase